MEERQKNRNYALIEKIGTIGFGEVWRSTKPMPKRIPRDTVIPEQFQELAKFSN